MKNILRAARGEAKMTQADLATRCGVSRQTINAVETGKYVPSTVLALKMAKTLQIPVERLFQLESDD